MSTLQPIKMRLWSQEDGQDVSEYGLLLAFIFLISACLFLANASNVTTIWEAANSFISHGSDTKSAAASNRLP
jgi:Flp pilus assembly pilin Flp